MADITRQIADAVLYEGYLLYPYRASAVKNRQRFNFGVLVPQAAEGLNLGTESSLLRTECLLLGESPIVQATVRFLHLVHRQAASAEQDLPAIEIEGKTYFTWDEVTEREIVLPQVSARDVIEAPQIHDAAFGPEESTEVLTDQTGAVRGRLARTQRQVQARISLRAVQLRPDLFRLRVEVQNTTPLPKFEPRSRDEVLPYALASAHMILQTDHGEFTSLLEPLAELTSAAQDCQQHGCWPVLVGGHGNRHTMLASPIILYDYPQVAAESQGDFFDATEIDEMLALRILTMTPQEQQEMRQLDDRARRLLERTEKLSNEQLRGMHGRFGESAPDNNWNGHEVEWPGLDLNQRCLSVSIQGVQIQAGAIVRLRPRRQADVMDMALHGRLATIEAIEQDLEGNIHLAVVVHDDPGSDLGMLRLPGHRFFFHVDEVELLDGTAG